MTVTAAAISGILKRAGYKRANARGTSWSSGFTVQDFGSCVRINYSTVNRDQTLQWYTEIVELLNIREDKKYWASLYNTEHLAYVEVYAYDETDPAQNEARKAEAQEKLAADHPAAPAIADVKKALRNYSQYDADVYSTGYKVERLEEDTRLVRVRLVESSCATYEVSRDVQIAQTLANYARVLVAAGFEIKVLAEEMSVIVAMAGEWTNTLSVETVETVLGSIYTVYSGKTGGFVVRDYARDNGALRVEHYEGIGKGEQHMQDVVQRYANLLMKTGYDVVVDYQDEWAVLVRLSATPDQVVEESPAEQESDEVIARALYELRIVMEGHLAVVTRKAGPWSIFVFNANRDCMRLEVSYFDGQYRTKGYQSRGEYRYFRTLTREFQEFVWAELGL
jgi:hypothetical protein